MKTCFLLITFFILPLHFQSGLYGIHFTTLDEQEISMASFEGKKIIVAPISGTVSDSILLRKLDSLQKNNVDSLVIITVPAIEFNTSIDTDSLRNTLGPTIIISKPGKVNKSAAEDQHPLFKWLTRLGENTHFDRDVEEAGQLFIISKKGTLYGILGRQTSVALVMEVLNNPVIE